MTPERWQRMKLLFEGALGMAPPEKEAFLERECPDDPDLRAEVRKLLENEQRNSEFLEPGRSPVSARSFACGDIVAGRFRIVRLLGRGGMGEVYEAEDTLLGERLALKAIRPEIASDPVTLARFRNEIQLARRITHLNVCRIFDLEVHEGGSQPVAFLTMELLVGETLAARLERTGPLAPLEALSLGRQMAEGLAAAHQCGVIHRDFKSGNVMLVPGREGGLRAVITDFGLARDPEAHVGSQTLTGSGKLMGTLDYMAPEQLADGECSFRSDIYSLGLVLFEMVTGKLPFPAHTPIGSAMRRVRDTPPSPRSLRPELSRTWEIVIARCLEQDPSRRYGSAAGVALALSPAQTSARLRYSLRRTEIWVPALVILAIFVAAVVTVVRIGNRPPPMAFKPVPLTSSPGIEFQPAFSRDGELVAFAWDGQKQDNVDIYFKQITSGVTSRLTTDPALDISPAWSPDGRQIAFRRVLPQGTSQIVVKSYLGGPERKLAEWPYASAEQSWKSIPVARDICWSADGEWVIGTGRNSPGEAANLFAIAVKTGETRRLTRSSQRYVVDSGPALSPDGRMLAFSRVTELGGTDLYILPVSDHLVPAGDPIRITFDHRNSNAPAWTGDGKAIIFSSDRQRPRGLWRIAVSGTSDTQTRQLPERLAGIGEDADYPAISRDGRRLAYSQAAVDLNIWEVHLPDRPGQAATAANLISSTRLDLFPDFSPDGKKIAFGSDRSGHHEIWTCDREGANPTQLTSFGAVTTDPRWSPDSRLITFLSRTNEGSHIYVISAQGGTPHRLTNEPSDFGAPSWSRDGKWVYYNHPQNGQYQLWKMPSGGGTPVQVTKSGVFAQESVDRKYLYYSRSRGYNTSLWRIAVDGGEEIQVLPSVSFGRNFAVTEQGIYFIPWNGHIGNLMLNQESDEAVVQFLSFATGTTKTVFATKRPVFMGLAVSPDSHSLLYTQIDRTDSDLWLVENFR